MHGSDRVRKTSVNRTRKHEMEQPVLTNVAEPLEDPRVDDGMLDRAKHDVTMDGVPDRDRTRGLWLKLGLRHW
jgi:hypothetical protein